MKHTDVDQVRSLADVQPASSRVMTRRERLERWAELLEREPYRQLSTLDRVEFTPEAERPFMRADNSPLTVAFEDPVLRAAGLKSDRLGDALDLFLISEEEVHHIVCPCPYEQPISAGTAAARVRSLDQVHWIVPASAMAALAGVPVLFHLLG